MYPDYLSFVPCHPNPALPGQAAFSNYSTFAKVVLRLHLVSVLCGRHYFLPQIHHGTRTHRRRRPRRLDRRCGSPLTAASREAKGKTYNSGVLILSPFPPSPLQKSSTTSARWSHSASLSGNSGCASEYTTTVDGLHGCNRLLWSLCSLSTTNPSQKGACDDESSVGRCERPPAKACVVGDLSVRHRGAGVALLQRQSASPQQHKAFAGNVLQGRDLVRISAEALGDSDALLLHSA